MALCLSAHSDRRKGTKKRFDERTKTDVNPSRGDAPYLDRSFGSQSGSRPHNGVWFSEWSAVSTLLFPRPNSHLQNALTEGQKS
jgi:hypothetical protein